MDLTLDWVCVCGGLTALWLSARFSYGCFVLQGECHGYSIGCEC